jgi:hypothetical protein
MKVIGTNCFSVEGNSFGEIEYLATSFDYVVDE